MELKKTYREAPGYTPLCGPGESSLRTLEFGILRLSDKERFLFDTGEKETAFIVLEGSCHVSFDDTEWRGVGGRASVFEHHRAACFYMPIRQKLTIEGSGSVRLAVCAAPASERTQPELLRAERVPLKTLGVPPWERETSFLIDGTTNARTLTIGEAYPTPGNWAGFPPHKHDADAMPAECIAEELYFFQFEPRQGFAVQCVYTADGTLDKAYRVQNDELVEFPYGYHTTVAAPGYQSYFLWVMAGTHQGFHRSADPAHAWVEHS